MAYTFHNQQMTYGMWLLQIVSRYCSWSLQKVFVVPDDQRRMQEFGEGGGGGGSDMNN